VYLYLQPLTPDAARPTFAITSVSALTDTGAEYPLKVTLRRVGAADGARQRLLASGRVPTGSYTGFAFTFGDATSRDRPAPASVALPAAPVTLDFAFTVAQRQAPVVWLTLAYRDAEAGQSGPMPTLTAYTPSRPVADHMGFVANSGSSTIAVFDKNLAQVMAVIDGCGDAAGIVLDEPRRRMYVACSGDDEIQAIDVATGELIERSRLSPGDRPRELALTPDGKTLASVNAGSNSVSLFDTTSLTRQERITVGDGPASILMDDAGRRAFVFNTLSSSLSVVDIATRSVVATVSTESSPLRGRFNRRGDRLYVIHERSPYMTVLDPLQLSMLTRARLRVGITAIAIDRVRDLICVGGRDAGVDFLDPNALMPLYSMRTKAGVSYLAIDADNNSLYMSSPETRSVFVARLASRQVVSEIDVGEGPGWIAVMGEK
jgi:YVTN family beta-propeller protein